MLTCQVVSLLLTGSTGLVGRLLLHHCRHQPVLAVTRRPAALGLNVSAVLGDLADPAFSLGGHLANVTEIVHCAAAVRFDLPLSEARAINTEGTARLLHAARRMPKLRKFTHVSTVYVMGNNTGDLPEDRYSAASYPNTYEQSKAEAESLVLEASTNLPVQIVRVSSIAGNALTGVVTQFNHIHQLLKLFQRGTFPIIPGAPNNPVDLIAEDWTASSLWHLHEQAFQAGSIAHLCAGPGAALPLGEMLELCARIYGYPAPKLAAPAEFERLRNLNTDRTMEILGLFLPHLGHYQNFLNAKTLARIPAAPPAVHSFLPGILRYCALGAMVGA